MRKRDYYRIETTGCFDYLIFAFSMIRFSYSACVKMTFSSSNSTRLESIVSRRSISSAGSRLTLLVFTFSTFYKRALLRQPVHDYRAQSIGSGLSDFTKISTSFYVQTVMLQSLTARFQILSRGERPKTKSEPAF